MFLRLVVFYTCMKHVNDMCYDARGMGASPQNICLVLLKHYCNFWWLAAFLIGRTVCMSRRAFGNLLLACSVAH